MAKEAAAQSHWTPRNASTPQLAYGPQTVSWKALGVDLIDSELHPGLGKVAQYGTAAIQVPLKLPAPFAYTFRDVAAAIQGSSCHCYWLSGTGLKLTFDLMSSINKETDPESAARTRHISPP